MPNLIFDTPPTFGQATLAVMKSHPDNRTVVINALKALYNLAILNMAAMKSLDAILIVRTLKLYHPSDVGVQKEADKLLGLLQFSCILM